MGASLVVPGRSEDGSAGDDAGDAYDAYEGGSPWEKDSVVGSEYEWDNKPDYFLVKPCYFLVKTVWVGRQLSERSLTH